MADNLESSVATEKKLFIIDLMPFLYRGHFVFLKNPRMTGTGINTSALLGFVNGLLSVLGDGKPSHAVLAMEPPSGVTFRHQAYPSYKAQREKMPEDLAASIPYAFEVADAMNIPIVRAEGFEADDVMGSIAVRAAAEGFEVYLVTPDKDAAQLVAPGIKLFRPRKAGEFEIYDTDAVCKNWSLAGPAQMIDYLALAGDTADNIPGVRGVGEKTAASLLARYGTLDGVLAHAGEIKGKLSEKLTADAELAKMSRFLAEIRTDVPLEINWDDYLLREPDAQKLAAVCSKFELNALARKFLGNVQEDTQSEQYKTIADVPHDYRLVESREEAAVLAAELMRHSKVAFDTETTGVNPRTARLVGMSFAVAPGKAWYVSVPRVESRSDDLFAFFSSGQDTDPDARIADFISVFAPVFADPNRILIAQNAKYDYTVLSRYGIVFGSVIRDTMLEDYVLDAASRHGMDILARKYLGYSPIPIESLIGEKKRTVPQKNMADLAPSQICDYAAEDADVTFRLDEVLRPKVEEAGALTALTESEEPLVNILSEMEREGVKMDTGTLGVCSRELDAELVSLIERIRQYAPADLNIDSPKQLSAFLFETLALDTAGIKKTTTGEYSTEEKTLRKLFDAHPVVPLILEYRACTRLKSTYVDKLPECIDPVDGRIHTVFSQALTETGRLSSYDPNLQNIPVRSERGKTIRASVVARDCNHVLMAADYSQIELRIMAHMSSDEAMCEAFRSGFDIHRDTASRVYSLPPEEVTPAMRNACKMVNFGIIYGISAFGLAQRLGVSRKEAAKLIETYFELYPGVRKYMEKSIADARKSGYAVTMLGRRRTLRDINSRNATARQAAERDAINTPIQGSAADLIKLAMVRVDRKLKELGMKTKMILQIHDELLFDVPVDEVDAAKAIVKDAMEGAMKFDVPLEVSIGTGKNWMEAH